MQSLCPIRNLPGLKVQKATGIPDHPDPTTPSPGASTRIWFATVLRARALHRGGSFRDSCFKLHNNKVAQLQIVGLPASADCNLEDPRESAPPSPAQDFQAQLARCLRGGRLRWNRLFGGAKRPTLLEALLEGSLTVAGLEPCWGWH